MDTIFFSDWQSLVLTVIITVAAYAALIFILRIPARRTLFRMNAFDLIVAIAPGPTLAAVMLNKDVTLSEGVLAVSLLVLLQCVITYFSSRNKHVSRLVKSAPTSIAYKAGLLQGNMHRERIDEDEVWAVLREKGGSSLCDVDAVVPETDGSPTVTRQITHPQSPAMPALSHGETLR